VKRRAFRATDPTDEQLATRRVLMMRVCGVCDETPAADSSDVVSVMLSVAAAHLREASPDLRMALCELSCELLTDQVRASLG
jgi:hypothetical protein